MKLSKSVCSSSLSKMALLCLISLSFSTTNFSQCACCDTDTVPSIRIGANATERLETWTGGIVFMTLEEEIEETEKVIEAKFYRNSEMTVFPPEIYDFCQIREINIRYCSFKKIEEDIAYLKKLEKIDVSRNGLVMLPQGIGKLPNLIELMAENNELEALPEMIGDLPSIEKMYFSNNKLKALPEKIGNLSTLEQLGLFGNELEKLPENLQNLSNLEELVLTDNRLKELPINIGKLPKLKKLMVSDNQLTEIPESIGDIRSLRRLEFKNNAIKSLPASINLENLPNLRFLHLEGNPISAEHQEELRERLPRTHIHFED